MIKLTAFEYTIMETLIRNNGKVVSKDSLMLQLYPDAELRESHTIDVLMGRLRKNSGTISPRSDYHRSRPGLSVRIALMKNYCVFFPALAAGTFSVGNGSGSTGAFACLRNGRADRL